jgi:hypothetical protein
VLPQSLLCLYYNSLILTAIKSVGFFSIPIITMSILTFTGCKEQFCPIRCMYSSPKMETNVLQCAFKLSSALAAAKPLHLKGRMLNANEFFRYITSYSATFKALTSPSKLFQAVTLDLTSGNAQSEY